MSLFVIGDLHLSFGVQKPMDIFSGWEDHTSKLSEAWHSMIKDDDTIVLAGDLSWAMSLEQALADFQFIDTLPGKKIIIKGNHDYWWNSAKKMNEFFNENNLTTLSIMHNNSFLYENVSLCGTRGWIFEKGQPFDVKISQRECGRLRASLESARTTDEKIVFLHYPPIFCHERAENMIDLMCEHGVKKCYYGHLHGKSIKMAHNGEHRGIGFRLIAADFLYFRPLKIM